MPPKTATSPKKATNVKAKTAKVDEKEELEKQQQLEAERLEQKRLSDLEQERKPKSFTDADFVVKCRAIQNQNELLSTLSKDMKMDDYLSNKRTSILFDYFISHLNFAKEYSLTLKKTVKFMALMDEIIKQIAANQSSDEIKNLITSNLFKFTQDVASTPRVQSRVDSVQRTESQATNTDQDVNIEDVQSERETAVVFSIQDIHDIAEHILNDVIRHHSLYNFVFNYEQIEDVQRYELLVDTSASVIPLKSMQTKEAYDAAILKAQEDKEQQERDKIANEERLRFEREQAQLVHEEAVKADVDFGPQLSEDLLGIAEWLRANVQADFDVKKDDLISKLNVLLETVDPTADKKDKKKPPVVKK